MWLYVGLLRECVCSTLELMWWNNWTRIISVESNSRHCHCQVVNTNSEYNWDCWHCLQHNALKISARNKCFVEIKMDALTEQTWFLSQIYSWNSVFTQDFFLVRNKLIDDHRSDIFLYDNPDCAWVRRIVIIIAYILTIINNNDDLNTSGVVI